MKTLLEERSTAAHIATEYAKTNLYLRMAIDNLKSITHHHSNCISDIAEVRKAVEILEEQLSFMPTHYELVKRINRELDVEVQNASINQ